MSGGTTSVLEPSTAGAASAGAGSGSPRPSGLLVAATACVVGAVAALALLRWGGLAGSIPIAATGYLAGSIAGPVLLVLRRAARSHARRAGARARRGVSAAVPALLVLGLLAGTSCALLIATELAK